MSKILVLTNSINGLYNFRKEILQELISKGFDVTIASPHDLKVSYFIELGCQYTEININRRGTNPLDDLKLLSNYIKLIKNKKPNIVLTYTIKPNVYGGIACQLLKTSYLANITGLGTSIENKGLIQKISLNLYKFSLKKASYIFFQNAINNQFFIEKNIVKSNTILIPGSGVNLNEHIVEDYPSNDKIIKFLFIGRVMKAKGINELLKAAEIIKRKYPQVQFDLIGGKEEDYTSLLNQLEENNIVKYHGHQNDVHGFIKNSHAVINPSHHEGMSNVLLEAASTGRPILASNIAGCRETFEENVSGYGFEVKNVSSLVETITKFIELPYEQKKKMGLCGREKVEKDFDRCQVVNTYMKKIDEVLKN